MMFFILLFACASGLIKCDITVVRKETGDVASGGFDRCLHGNTFLGGRKNCIKSSADIGCFLYHISKDRNHVATIQDTKQIVYVDLSKDFCLFGKLSVHLRYWNLYHKNKGHWTSEGNAGDLWNSIHPILQNGQTIWRFTRHWPGMLLKINLGCSYEDNEQIAYHAGKCLVMKFAGKITYPITSSYFRNNTQNIRPTATTTKRIISQTNTEANVKTVLQTSRTTHAPKSNKTIVGSTTTVDSIKNGGKEKILGTTNKAIVNTVTTVDTIKNGGQGQILATTNTTIVDAISGKRKTLAAIREPKIVWKIGVGVAVFMMSLLAAALVSVVCIRKVSKKKVDKKGSSEEKATLLMSSGISSDEEDMNDASNPVYGLFNPIEYQKEHNNVGKAS